MEYSTFAPFRDCRWSHTDGDHAHEDHADKDHADDDYADDYHQDEDTADDPPYEFNMEESMMRVALDLMQMCEEVYLQGNEPSGKLGKVHPRLKLSQLRIGIAEKWQGDEIALFNIPKEPLKEKFVTFQPTASQTCGGWGDTPREILTAAHGWGDSRKQEPASEWVPQVFDKKALVQLRSVACQYGCRRRLVAVALTLIILIAAEACKSGPIVTLLNLLYNALRNTQL